MKKIILCEGSTDTAFLGYYMSKVFGWKYVSVNDKDLTSVGITNRKSNESMKWYKKENDFLAICGVGGKDNFKKFFEVQLKEMITLTGDFDKIAVVTDRDDKSIKSIEEALDLTYENMDIRFRENEWLLNSYIDGYSQKKRMDSLLLVIPREEEGALETLMLKAISEDEYDKNIVEGAREFIDGIKPKADKYLRNKGLETKACLGVTWAVQYPENQFKYFREKIVSVPWEKYDNLKKSFGKLGDL